MKVSPLIAERKLLGFDIVYLSLILVSLKIDFFFTISYLS